MPPVSPDLELQPLWFILSLRGRTSKSGDTGAIGRKPWNHSAVLSLVELNRFVNVCIRSPGFSDTTLWGNQTRQYSSSSAWKALETGYQWASKRTPSASCLEQNRFEQWMGGVIVTTHKLWFGMELRSFDILTPETATPEILSQPEERKDCHQGAASDGCEADCTFCFADPI